MKKFKLKESELTKIIQKVITEREQYMNEKDSDDDDRPHNWKELPGYNPDHFHGGGSLDKLRNMVQDEEKDTWWESIKQKLAGVNAEQLAYNKEYNLPSTWKGSKEGYHEHITNKKFDSGSN
jgi:hypothetical protein|tara:strand:+ start:1782 stop:2147 length:366 start_codon:yes stop_codon:yes gene_type:complete